MRIIRLTPQQARAQGCVFAAACRGAQQIIRALSALVRRVAEAIREARALAVRVRLALAKVTHPVRPAWQSPYGPRAPRAHRGQWAPPPVLALSRHRGRRFERTAS